MKYVNSQMKIDQIIGYFNDKKINLIPPFQRGSVWNKKFRQKLIENMVSARPIPAIFLYKQDAGDQFSYNILDGKQRLESLILFIGDQRTGMKVDNVIHYFYGKPARKDINFSIKWNGKDTKFKDLDDSLVRLFREYAIPTIEIDLDDENASVDEIVNLFIDINQYGVKVSRFDVVNALGDDPLFKQVFKLFATKPVKKRSVSYKFKASSFSFVMSKVNIINKLGDKNAQVEKTWERLTEIALFARSKQHRSPAGILKSFINPNSKKNPELTNRELTEMRSVFGFMERAYKQSPSLAKSEFATDQPQFYTVVTTLFSTDLLERFDENELIRRLTEAAQILNLHKPSRKFRKQIDEYRTAVAKQTTNPNRRETRHQILVELIDQL